MSLPTADPSEKTAPEQSAPEYTPLPWKLPDLDSLEEQREALYTPEERVRAWSETADVVKTYSDEMVTRWKEEIDTLLVFVRGCCRMEDV